MDFIEFFVPGEPVEKGSTKSFYIKKLDRVVTTAKNPKTKPWEGLVAMYAEQAGASQFREDDTHIGYYVEVDFYKSPPKSQPIKYRLALTRPDLDKYERAILDGITGVLMSDDSKVIGLYCEKYFKEFNEHEGHEGQPGAYVKVSKVRDG